MPDADVAINEIEALEDRRYRAMIDGDIAVLDELCSDDLIYTHSKGDHDDKRSYLRKVSIGVGSGPQIGIQKGPPRFAFRTISVRPVGAGRDCGDGASAG